MKEWNQQIIDLRKLFLGCAESGKDKDAQAFRKKKKEEPIPKPLEGLKIGGGKRVR